MKTSHPFLSYPLLILSCILCLVSLKDTASCADSTLVNHVFRVEDRGRLAWHLKMMLGVYGKTGHKDLSWDDAVTNAFRMFAYSLCSDGADLDLNYLLPRYCRKATDAGSDDPMIAYLLAREDDINGRSRPFDVKPAMRRAADRLFVSGYPALYKLNAASRAGGRVKVPGASKLPPEILPYRQRAMQYFAEILEDKTTPQMDVYDAFRLLFDGMQGDDAAMEIAYKTLEPALFKYSTNAALHHLVKAKFNIAHAWSARGSGYADTVSSNGWRLFGQRLRSAVAELEAAWKLEPKWAEISIEMITVQKGLDGGNRDMELWFQRAMQADPDNYRACTHKLSFLEPKWGGSEEAMLAFARQCATSTNWSGEVPLILEKAHDTLSKYFPSEERNNYWKREGIWPEVKAAFDRYYNSRHPMFSELPDTGSRSRLVRVAYRTRHYDEMLDLLRSMKEIDLDLFGGREQFVKVLAYANSKATRPLRKDEFPAETQAGAAK